MPANCNNRKDHMKKTTVKKSSTVLKTLRMLETISENGGEMTLSDIAQTAELDRSTAYRLLRTLEEAGYIAQSETTKRYRLSYKVLSLGQPMLRKAGLDDIIIGALKQLAQATHETANFQVLDGEKAVIRLQAKGTQLLSVDFKVGDRSRLHCTSIGKALLAHQDPEFVDLIIAKGLDKVASRTITDPDDLRAELARVRDQGYATDEFEFADDLCCVAVPVLTADGVLCGGINFAGPKSRFDAAHVAELRDALLETTGNLRFLLDRVEPTGRGAATQ